MEQNELIGLLQAKYIESQDLDERLNLVTQQISELEDFARSLNDLKNSEEKDFLASLGKGVFLPAQIKEKELFIGVGSGIFVKKKPDAARDVIKVQVERLIEMKGALLERNEELNKEMQGLMKGIEN